MSIAIANNAEGVRQTPSHGFRFLRGDVFFGSWDLLVAAAAMSLVSFTIPGRVLPGAAANLDLMALAKLAIRMMVILWFGGQLAICWFQAWRNRVGDSNREQSIGQSVLFPSATLLPWFLFGCWAGASVIWSPLKTVSAGQWLGLLALLLFALSIATRCTGTNDSDRQLAFKCDWRTVLSLLYLVLTCYSLSVFAIHGITPQYSGLDRSVAIAGSNGFVHPTAVGATASLGCVIGMLLWFSGLNPQRWLIASATLIHIACLYLSQSRAAMLSALVACGICTVVLVPMRQKGLGMAGLGLAIFGLVVANPSLSVLDSSIAKSAEYLQRGQSINELTQGSGRLEMWEAICGEIAKSPWMGHGYFVTSELGSLDVWDGPANHDAHNIFLQVLVSMGLVGLVLFVWALLVQFSHLLRLFRSQALAGADASEQRILAWVLSVIAIWFLVWSQGCVTFLGPIRPESVVFFGLLGILAGSRASFCRRARI